MSRVQARLARAFRVLSDAKEAMSTRELADTLGVSPRTVHADLDRLADILSKAGISLVKRPGLGVWLEGSEEQKNRAGYILKNHVDSQTSSALERRRYILWRLLGTRRTLTTKELASELYFSRPTILKDLDDIEQWLSARGLTLVRKQNHGIEVEGPESAWRRAVSDYLTESIDRNQLLSFLRGPAHPEVDLRLESVDFGRVGEALGGISLRPLVGLVKDAEKQLGFKFADDGFAGLVLHLAITVRRLKEGRAVSMPEHEYESIQDTEEYQAARNIAMGLSRLYELEIPRAEVGYICLHLLGGKVYRGTRNEDDDVTRILESLDKPIVDAARQLIEVAEGALGRNLSSDQKLLVGLALHLRAVVNRLKHNLGLRNPLLNEIKALYPGLVGVAWIGGSVLENKFGVKVNEEEIGYIAMHLGASLERLSRPIKTLIVCSSGIGTAEVLASRVERLFPEIKVKEIASLLTLKEAVIDNEPDLIVSTIPIPLKGKQVVEVSPLLSERDLKKLKDAVAQYTKSSSSKPESTALDQILDDDLIIPNLKAASRTEVLEKMGELVLSRGHVTEGFLEAVLAREEYTSTAVGNGVAIPHADPRFIKRPAVCIATLREPVGWGQDMVDIVIMLCLKFSKSGLYRDMAKKLFAILDNKDYLKQIREADTKAEIRRTMTHLENKKQ